jgi:hypothetical protein
MYPAAATPGTDQGRSFHSSSAQSGTRGTPSRAYERPTCSGPLLVGPAMTRQGCATARPPAFRAPPAPSPYIRDRYEKSGLGHATSAKKKTSASALGSHAPRQTRSLPCAKVTCPFAEQRLCRERSAPFRRSSCIDINCRRQHLRKRFAERLLVTIDKAPIPPLRCTV